MLLLLTALQAGVQLVAPTGGDTSTLPSSLQHGVLAACAPVTLTAAEECLRASLSAEELAIVQDRIPARRYRPALDCEIAIAWRLGDPASPMARVMDGLLGLHHPQLAAGMIISDVQARAQNDNGFPFDEIRERLRQSPPPPPDSDFCPAAHARPS